MDIVFECPHCKDAFIINEKELNCMIVRHASYKHNLKPINPHSTKLECDNLLKEGKVVGCAKPIQIIKENNKYTTIKCDYI